ncbi:MAG: flagellar hook-basal body protein [Bacteroides sp.]|nr:flagellar hook-basal body protein [Eubacterium sp.]MCM1418405.1 flagellar hook-basal body protein [Roseburia sp.]MCM1461573.1 flagellar hook-basal body protein [Bacteroides sp.]
MLRGFYNAAQAMINKQRQLDAIGNNLVNANTAGYRKDEVVLTTFMDELILVNERKETSGHFLQTYVDDSKTNLEQSNFTFTDSNFDVGIYGNVYFNILARDGEVYQTRNGQWELDGEGYLILGKSGRVQGQNGDIYLGTDDFLIENDGTILINNEPIDRLLLTYIPPEADVDKIGDNLMRYDGDGAIPEGEFYDVIQGAWEHSNVDGNKEVTQMMEAHRLYEANSKILRYLDSINSRAVEIASIQL